MGVKYLHVSGKNISVGDFATFITSPDAHVHITTWNADKHDGKIEAGKFCLFSPGVRISAATSIKIGDSCMFANGAYISDSDWHGIYDRAQPVGKTKPVILEDNVWIGDSAIICKGVTIGKNSIIGAGAVVTKDVPDNSIYAGNPAKLVKKLDQDSFISRKDFFNDPIKLAKDFDALDRYNLKNNSIFNWVKSIVKPDNTH